MSWLKDIQQTITDALEPVDVFVNNYLDVYIWYVGFVFIIAGALLFLWKFKGIQFTNIKDQVKYINPMANIGPSDLNIAQLLNRLQTDEVKEIIVALNPNIEGEATTTYLSRLLTPLDVKVTRLASGLPVGGDLEYADEITLSRALQGRQSV